MKDILESAAISFLFRHKKSAVEMLGIVLFVTKSAKRLRVLFWNDESSRYESTWICRNMVTLRLSEEEILIRESISTIIVSITGGSVWDNVVRRAPSVL